VLLGRNIVYKGRRLESAGVVTVTVHAVTKSPFLTLTIDDRRLRQLLMSYFVIAA